MKPRKCVGSRCKRYRSSDRESSRWRLVAAAAIVIMIMFLVPVSSRLLSQSPAILFTVGHQDWTVSAEFYGAQFGDKTFLVSQASDPNNLPAQMIQVSDGKSLKVDADRNEAVQIPPYTGLGLEPAMEVTWLPIDGVMPQVYVGMSLVWHVNRNGEETDPWTPDSTWTDSAGRHMERHYFLVQVYAQTESHLCGDFYQAGLLPPTCFNTYESGRIHVALWVKVIVQNPTSNASFVASFSSAKVVAPPTTKQGAININNNPYTYIMTDKNHLAKDDYPYYAINDQTTNVAAGVMNNELGQGGGSFIMQVSGDVQPGVRFDYGLLGETWGSPVGNLNPVDVLLTYGILFCMDLSSPPSANPSIPAQWIQFFTYLVGVAEDPSNPWFWVLVAIVVVIIAWLLRPRKKQQQTQELHIHMEGRKLPALTGPQERR